MFIWEDIQDENDPNRLMDEMGRLKQLGNEGWELISVLSEHGDRKYTYTYYLKRPIEWLVFSKIFIILLKYYVKLFTGECAIYAALRASETVPKGIIVPTPLVVNENPSAKGNLC